MENSSASVTELRIMQRSPWQYCAWDFLKDHADPVRVRVLAALLINAQTHGSVARESNA